MHEWELYMSPEFKCLNCRELKLENERAELSVFTKLIFLVTNVILGGGITWSTDLCRQCVEQRYLLAALVLTGLGIVVLFF
jgi:hypothetical protein